MNFPSLPKNIVLILEKTLDSHMIHDKINHLQLSTGEILLDYKVVGAVHPLKYQCGNLGV